MGSEGLLLGDSSLDATKAGAGHGDPLVPRGGPMRFNESPRTARISMCVQ